jgi:Pectate lyase superfamily protein
MGTWVLNGTTIKLEDNTNTVAIGSDTTPAGTKLVVTGPARLPLQDQGGEVYNVRAYGAIGDGVTDDRRAVQDAIDAAEAAAMGIVYFPPGTYLIQDLAAEPDLLTFTKPVQFRGAGPFLSIVTTDEPTKNIFHGTITVTDINDKVRPILFRDLKIEATLARTDGAAILQDVAPGSTFEHGIRIENCHFKKQHIGVQLRAASTSVIENCSFWQGIVSEVDVWIDEQVGGDSTTHLITGCLFGDTGGASKAIKLGGHCGGDRILGNLFVDYDTQVHMEPLGATSQLIQGNVMEGARTAAIRLTGAEEQVHTVITGNAIRVSGGAVTPSRCIWADLSGSGAFADQILVVGNKLVGDMAGAGTKGIELSPTGGAATDRWLIADNLFHRFTIAIEAGASVTGLMLGSNAYFGNVTDLVNNSTGSKGATFLDRIGVGAENSVTPSKELHIKSTHAVRPRIYLEGLAGTSSPAVEFAFDSTNTRRAAVVGTAAGASGVQLELFTKPDGSGVARRLVLDKDGNALWTSANFQEMGSVPGDPAAPATSKARLFMRDNGAGKTQFCVRFPTGAVQVLATEP